MTNFTGTAGNDTFTGGAGTDNFDLTQGGDDTAKGGNGYDSFTLGAAFTAADRLDGGAGYDYLYLNGDYSTQLVLSAGSIVNVENWYFYAGHSYNIKTNDANNVGSYGVTISGYNLGPTDSLSFDASSETSSPYYVNGGAGDDTIRTGGGADYAYLSYGGKDSVNTGAGNDSIYGYDKITAADHIDGGPGNDSFSLSGDYAAGLTFGPNSLKNIESLSLNGDFDYKLKFADANVANDQSIYIYGSGIGPAHKLTVDATAETGGTYTVSGGPGVDVVNLGAGDDTLYGNGGNDKLSGGDGDDYVLGGPGKDTLTGGAGGDLFAFDDDDSLPGSPDLITDLTNSDLVDLSSIDANTGVIYDQSFTLVSAFSHTAGELIVTYDGGSDVTSFQMDTNGDAIADQVVQASGHHTSFTNFYL